MTTSFGLSQINGVFPSTTELQKYGGPVNTTVAVDNGTNIQWYRVKNVNDGNAVTLNSGLFANPVNEVLSGKVNPLTVTGTAVAGGQINQMRDSGAFTAPAADSVDADTILVIELPKVHATETPTLTADGGDLFEDDEGTDTVISWVGPAKVTLTSNGVDKWSL